MALPPPEPPRSRRPRTPTAPARPQPLARVRAALALPVARARAALALPLALGLGGCAVGTSPCEPRLTYAVASPPPRPLTETPSARPTPGMVWVPGYWHWDAICYVWVPGHWETPPPGRRWLPAETRSEGGAYRYYAGVWGCDAG
jgi:YXWGXW repeat-containing protein